MADQATATNCVVCGLSCEGKPHAKDAKGRLICRPCLDLKKAEKAGGQDTMAALLAKSKMANAVPCPSCKSYMAQGAVLCGHCGFNTQTGKAITTRVYAAPKEKKQKAARSGPSFNVDPIMGAWLMGLVYVGLIAGVFSMPSMLPALIAVVAVHGLVVGIWALVGVILDGDAVWILLGFIPIVGGFLWIYYMLAKTERTALRAHWLFNVGATIMTLLLATSFAPEELSSAMGEAIASALA